MNVTAPGPLPVGVLSMVSHAAVFAAAHGQLAVAVTVTVKLPPDAGTARVAGEIVIGAHAVVYWNWFEGTLLLVSHDLGPSPAPRIRHRA